METVESLSNTLYHYDGHGLNPVRECSGVKPFFPGPGCNSAAGMGGRGRVLSSMFCFLSTSSAVRQEVTQTVLLCVNCALLRAYHFPQRSIWGVREQACSVNLGKNKALLQPRFSQASDEDAGLGDRTPVPALTMQGSKKNVVFHVIVMSVYLARTVPRKLYK